MHEAAVEVRGEHVGEHRPTGRVAVPVLGAYGGRATVVHVDAGDPGRRTDDAAERLGPAGEGPGQLPGTTLGHREAHRLPEHRHQHGHQAGAGGIERDVGVPRVAAEQQAGSAAAEVGAADVGRRRQQQPDQVETAGRTQVGERLQTRAHGRERGHQPADEVVADRVPPRAELQPGLAVAGVLGVETLRGALAVPVQQSPRTVRGGVPEHRGGVPPPQPVVLETEAPDRRGGQRQRVERAERVVHVVRVHVARAPHRSADLRLRLQHQHGPAGVEQMVGGDQAVRPRADDHRVVRRAVGAARPGHVSAPPAPRPGTPAVAGSRRCARR